MDTNCIDRFALEASTLEVVNEETEWGGGISSWKNVSVHEKTPGEVLELPGLAKTSNLQEENSIIIKHLVDLAQEGSEMADTNVLSHLKAGDLVVTPLWNWDVTVIHAQDAGLLLWNAGIAEASVTPGSLVTSKCDTGNVCAEVDRGELGKSSPSAANVEHSLALLKIDLLADNGELIVLKLLKCLLLVDVGDDTRGVDHAWAKEPAVEVIASIVMVADLFLIWKGG